MRFRCLAFAGLVWLLGLEAASAAPRLGLEVVDVRGLPDLLIQFSVRDITGEPIPGLRSEDFRLTLDGAPLEDLNVAPAPTSKDRAVVFVLECAARLKGKDFFQIRNLVAEIVDRMAPGDRVGLVALSESVSVPVSLTVDRAAFKLALGELAVSGDSVPLNAGVSKALQQLRAANAPQGAVILLSSGQAVADAKSQEDVVAQSRELRIPVHVIAAGLRFDAPELTAYADLTGGRFYPEPISANAVDLVRRALSSGSGRYGAQVRLPAAMDETPHHAVLELFVLGQSVNQEFSFLMSTGTGIPPEAINEHFRRSAARQSWWMVYFGAILGGIAGVLLRDRLGLRAPIFRFLALVASLATGALLGFVFSRLSAP